eukprot:2923783-Rhodomonas_salina.7
MQRNDVELLVIVATEMRVDITNSFPKTEEAHALLGHAAHPGRHLAHAGPDLLKLIAELLARAHARRRLALRKVGELHRKLVLPRLHRTQHALQELLAGDFAAAWTVCWQVHLQLAAQHHWHSLLHKAPRTN